MEHQEGKENYVESQAKLRNIDHDARGFVLLFSAIV